MDRATAGWVNGFIGMLIFSGLGSFVSERALPQARRVMPWIFAAIGAMRRLQHGDEAIDLILHKGDERADDDIETLGDQRRHLVAHALAAAGGQHHERIAPREPRGDRLGLERSKRVIAVVAAEKLKHRRLRVTIPKRWGGSREGG